MTMRDKIAAIFEDARNDEVDAFDAADAIIMALLDMIPDLVWERSHMTPWDGDYHSLPTAYTIRCADDHGDYYDREDVDAKLTEHAAAIERLRAERVLAG